MEEIVVAFKTYFSFLGKHKALYEDVRSRCNKALIAIDTFSEQLQAVSTSPNDSKIIQSFPDIKSAITFKILMGLEQQLRIITSLIGEIEESTNCLNKYLAVIEDAIEIARRKQIGLADEIPTVPVTIDRLWEHALDCRQYYQALFAGLCASFTCLDYRDSSTISNLKKAFVEEDKLKKHMERCLMVSQVLLFEA